MEIVLKKVKLPPALIADSLLKIDLKVLNPDVVGTLVGISPTPEEVKELKLFKGDRSLLANPEKFIDAIKEIKGYNFRFLAL